MLIPLGDEKMELHLSLGHGPSCVTRGAVV
jgi:hypothetical protein